MCHAGNEKWEKINNGRRTAKSEKSQNAWKEGKLQVLGNIGSGHHQTEIKFKKVYLRRTRKFLAVEIS